MKLKGRGLIPTIIYHALLLLLLVFAGLTFPDPPPEEEGILVNFGTDETGFGDFEPMGDDQQAGDPEQEITQAADESSEEYVEPVQESTPAYTPPEPAEVDQTQDVEEVQVKEPPNPRLRNWSGSGSRSWSGSGRPNWNASAWNRNASNGKHVKNRNASNAKDRHRLSD
jgi:hypothetical protein